MADTHVDDKTRNNLAYIWSMAVIVFVGYIIVRFGEYKEILTLIIGFITGVAGTVLALYFGGNITGKQKTTTEITPDSTIITQEPIKDENKNNS